MKQFNLGEYLKNPSRKLITRDGMEARIICNDRNSAPGQDMCVIALVKDNRGVEWAKFYTTEGKYLLDRRTGNDLFFAPEKKEGWINIYDGFGGTSAGVHIYNSKADAKAAVEGNKACIATIKIEWEE